VNVDNFIEFARTVGKLKETKRTGWVKDAGLKHPESVADHSFRTSVLAMLLSDEAGLDTEKVMRLALLHDLEESITGDIIRSEKEAMDEQERYSMELEAFKKVVADLPESIRKKYIELWKEGYEGKTREAMLVKSIDRVEQAVQAQEYGDKYPDNKILALFTDENDLEIVSPETEKIIKRLLELKKNYE